LVPSFSAIFVFFVSFSPAFPVVKSIAVVVVGVVVGLVIADAVPDFFVDLVSALASFVWDVVVAFVALGAFGNFAVVVVAFGDGAALGAFGADTFTGAGPFPLGAASSGANARLMAIAVPTVILTIRMRFTSPERVAMAVPGSRVRRTGISLIYSMPYVMAWPSLVRVRVTARTEPSVGMQ